MDLIDTGSEMFGDDCWNLGCQYHRKYHKITVFSISRCLCVRSMYHKIKKASSTALFNVWSSRPGNVRSWTIYRKSQDLLSHFVNLQPHKASDTYNYGRRDLIGKRHAPRTIVTAVDVKSDLGFALFLSFALHIIDCNLVWNCGTLSRLIDC